MSYGVVCSSLEDLLTPDESVDMRKATIILWKNRNEPKVISELADILAEVSGRHAQARASAG
jgi:hypothetical protein